MYKMDNIVSQAIIFDVISKSINAKRTRGLSSVYCSVIDIRADGEPMFIVMFCPGDNVRVHRLEHKDGAYTSLPSFNHPIEDYKIIAWSFDNKFSLAHLSAITGINCDIFQDADMISARSYHYNVEESDISSMYVPD